MSFSRLGRFRSRLLAIDPSEATFARRGFPPADARARDALEAAGRAFLRGYASALESRSVADLHRALNTCDRPLVGFAYEGAAMALVLMDALSLRRGRFAAFLDGAGAPHVYLAFVGAGWACARLPRLMRPDMLRVDPLLGWLALDGWGFHHGFFQWRRYTSGEAPPGCLGRYARRAFDQGLGRALWFVHGASVDAVSANIAALPEARRSDMWSGVGLAATYAGGVAPADLRGMLDRAGAARPHVRQGAAFAAAARLRAGNVTPDTEDACEAICGLTAGAACQIVDAAARDLPATGDPPAYEIWRGRIRSALVSAERHTTVRKAG